MYSRTKTATKPTPMQIWIDRLRFVLGVVAVIAIAVTFALNRSEQADINNRITKVESPCLRYGSNSHQCHESFQAVINSITDFQLCLLLAQRPDLTAVSPADCRRIAHEERRKAEARRRAAGHQHAESESPVPAGAAPVPEPTLGSILTPSSPPPSPGGSGGGGSHHGGSKTPASAPVTPPPTPSPPASVPTPAAPSGSGEAPDNASENPGHSAEPPGQTGETHGQSSGSVVEIEAPGLPAHVCAPGVLGVNCS